MCAKKNPGEKILSYEKENYSLLIYLAENLTNYKKKTCTNKNTVFAALKKRLSIWRPTSKQDVRRFKTAADCAIRIHATVKFCIVYV